MIFSLNDDHQRPDQNLDVEPGRPMFNVFKVELEPLVEIGGLALGLPQ